MKEVWGPLPPPPPGTIHRRERTRNSWLTGFNIYIGVIIQAQLWKVSALIKYLDIIQIGAIVLYWGLLGFVVTR